ncbi:hypothetical protein L873DRAFT_1762660 [Choiromyces venosus 120613-1]|uniref:Uncharacterized protein n=1 Tax=Choiromyces venosus 120613-1 TaxID=1336337 RepID=A0A3N4K1Z4_9PEZI|nr:hypothetical protein L873DRAFT_1762660 [Choiromyces venosus 120613-1]
MTSIKFVNTQAPRGSPIQYPKSNTSPVIPTSSSLPNVAASPMNSRPFDLEHQMRVFMVEKRGHGNQQQHNPASAPTAPFVAPPPRKYVRSSKPKPWFIAPPPGGRGLPPAIATSATYYVASGKVVTRTELRPVHRGSPTLSHKSSSSTSSSPVEAPSVHNHSRSKNNHLDNTWGVRPAPGAAPPTAPHGPNDIFWAAPSPSNSAQPSPNPRSLTHIESPLLPPPPSTTLLGRSGSLTRRNNSELRIVPPPLTPTGAAGKTGLPPPPVSPPMPKPRSSPGRARKTPVSRTSDVLDTVYSIYNKLPSSRDRSNSDCGDRDFVSRLATRIVPRRNTPSPSPPSIGSLQPITQPQIGQLPPPPPPPPKPRPGDVSPPIIPLVELPGTIPSTPPQSRSPARRRSPKPRSPRNPKSPQSPPPSQESKEVYSKLPLPAIPTPTPTKPLFSSGPSPLPQLSPLSIPPTSPGRGKTGMTGNFDADLGYAVELVEWFENFCYPCESASTVTTFSPQTPNSSTTSPSYPLPPKKKKSAAKTTSTDVTVIILSDEESPVAGRQQFTNPPQPKTAEMEHSNISPDFLSPFRIRNSGMCFPKRKPVPMSMYSTASSVGDSFRFDYDDLSPISDGGSTSGEDGEEEEDAIIAQGEGEKLQGEIEDILNNAVYIKDESEVESEDERRRTRYIAGRNSALEGDVIFCLKACEL